MIRPAALGGLFIGVLSALPLISTGNCCCCLWIVSGGAIAAYLQGQQQNRTLTGGEGAAVGALAGVIGALVWLPIAAVVAILLGPLQEAVVERILSSANDIPPQVREVLEGVGESEGGLGFILSFFFQLFMGAIFASIGGVLGAMYFKKEVPPALGGNWVPPLPPQ
jgi:hypothetical protein